MQSGNLSNGLWHAKASLVSFASAATDAVPNRSCRPSMVSMLFGEYFWLLAAARVDEQCLWPGSHLIGWRAHVPSATVTRSSRYIIVCVIHIELFTKSSNHFLVKLLTIFIELLIIVFKRCTVQFATSPARISGARFLVDRKFNLVNLKLQCQEHNPRCHFYPASPHQIKIMTTTLTDNSNESPAAPW